MSLRRKTKSSGFIGGMTLWDDITTGSQHPVPVTTRREVSLLWNSHNYPLSVVFASFHLKEHTSQAQDGRKDVDIPAGTVVGAVTFMGALGLGSLLQCDQMLRTKVDVLVKTDDKRRDIIVQAMSMFENIQLFKGAGMSKIMDSKS